MGMGKLRDFGILSLGMPRVSSLVTGLPLPREISRHEGNDPQTVPRPGYLRMTLTQE